MSEAILPTPPLNEIRPCEFRPPPYFLSEGIRRTPPLKWKVCEWCLGMRGWCLGMREWCLGKREWCLGMREWCLGMREWCLGMREWCLGMREWCLGKREWCLGKIQPPLKFLSDGFCPTPNSFPPPPAYGSTESTNSASRLP